VTTSSGYITHRLTGQFRDSAANARGLWPVDVGTIDWSDDPAAYAATGIPEGVPVYATANDKAVEALGAGVDDSTVLLSLGTYIAAMTTGAGPPGDDDAVWVNFAAEPGRYLHESNGIRRGMWTVSWAADLVYPRECRDPEHPVEHVLGAEAEAAPPGCGGLVAVLDWLVPPDAPYRRGALLGFDGSQRRGHVFRAVLEGVALTMADNIEAMEQALGRHPETLVVSGGGAKSDLILRMLADILDRPVRRTALDDAAGLGSAICACVGHGIHPDVETARRAMVRPGVTVDPDPTGVEAYVPVRRRHRAAREGVERLAATLASSPTL
jgi:xylulokinase